MWHEEDGLWMGYFDNPREDKYAMWQGTARQGTGQQGAAWQNEGALRKNDSWQSALQQGAVRHKDSLIPMLHGKAMYGKVLCAKELCGKTTVQYIENRDFEAGQNVSTAQTQLLRVLEGLKFEGVLPDL